MRVLLAGIFMSFCCFTLLILAGEVFGLPDKYVPFAVPLIFALTLYLAYLLFNPVAYRPKHWWNPFSRQTVEDFEKQGIVVSSEFRARRALQVEEWEDEGLHFFLELNDARVLFLSGQYLYDFQEITDEPELNQERRFPNSHFTVKRHKTEGFVLDVICHGESFEPEIVAPHFSLDDFPQDGDIFCDKTFEQIKAERLKKS